MREITCAQITQAVRDLCIRANCQLSEDIKSAICAARKTERAPVGCSILEDMTENYTFAQEQGLPICQDTGMAVVFCRLGQDVHITGGLLTDAINEGVRWGYIEGFLRKSVVGDPLRRVNTEDNTPAVIHLSLVAGDRLSITVAPKGFGSENMTSLHMLKPSASPEEVEECILSAVERAGSNPCPPVIVGVGLGGDAELAAILAKKALLRTVGSENPDPFYAGMEHRLLDRINSLGIGPQGLGGTTTALAVHITPHPTHIAGLPCCVNLGCHVTRHAQLTL